jgi:peptidoglycan/LPS O-acetylase OafA/YrhL
MRSIGAIIINLIVLVVTLLVTASVLDYLGPLMLLVPFLGGVAAASLSRRRTSAELLIASLIFAVIPLTCPLRYLSDEGTQIATSFVLVFFSVYFLGWATAVRLIKKRDLLRAPNALDLKPPAS